MTVEAVAIQTIDLIFTFFYLAIMARIILSWFRFDPYHPVSVFLYRVTEPILGFFRGIIPPVGMLDLSPIVAIVVLGIVQQMLFFVLQGL
ncbi:MAG TPA: YggT family protein [Anaerolineae bacterium]|nr:YggT family protein [Anaerolineae bacterium]